MKKLAMIAASILMISMSACTWTEKSYYESNNITAEDLERRWGKCDKVVKMADGTEKRVYKINAGEWTSETYFIKDGRVVSSISD